MGDLELKAITVSRYMDLLRTEQAEVAKREIANQKQEVRVMLKAMGISVDKLKIV